MKRTIKWQAIVAVLLAVLVPVGALAKMVNVSSYDDLVNAAADASVTKITVSGKIDVEATIKIGRDIKIEGADEMATLDGGGSVQILQVIGGDLTVSGVMFTGGKAAGSSYSEKSGGAIYVAAKGGNGGDATITNCTFTGNEAAGGGGAVYVGVDATIEGSVFEGNVAGSSGGGACIYGKGTIADSTFEGNEAGSSGGGACIYGKGTIADSTFEGNEAGWAGGGAYIAGEGTITDSTFDNNTAGLSGGGIYASRQNNSSLTIENTDFYDNTARNGSAIYLNGTGEIIVQGTNYFEANKNGNQGHGLEAENPLVYEGGEIIEGRRPEPDPEPTGKPGPVEAGVNNASSRYVATRGLTVYRDVEAAEKAGTLPAGAEVTVTHFSSGMAYIAGQGYVEMTGLARARTQLVP